jgi:hypothetical protein
MDAIGGTEQTIFEEFFQKTKRSRKMTQGQPNIMSFLLNRCSLVHWPARKSREKGLHFPFFRHVGSKSKHRTLGRAGRSADILVRLPACMDLADKSLLAPAPPCQRFLWVTPRLDRRRSCVRQRTGMDLAVGLGRFRLTASTWKRRINGFKASCSCGDTRLRIGSRPGLKSSLAPVDAKGRGGLP